MKREPFEYELSTLLAVTDGSAEQRVGAGIQEVLAKLRTLLCMDVVFVGKFENEARVLEAVDCDPALGLARVGDSVPLEKSWCQRIVDGLLPQFIADGKPLVASGLVPVTAHDIGTHLSVPVVLRSGKVYGTVCCYSLYVNQAASADQLRWLQATATLIAAQAEPALVPAG